MGLVRGVYGGGPFYPGPGSDAVVADVRASGFTTVVSWSVHVEPDGDLHLNDTPVVTGGSYSGDAGWGPMLAALKEQPTSVDTVLLSVGSGPPPQDFTNIAALLATPEGTATLEASFRALRAALPAVDGVDLDDEDLVEPDVIVGFSRLVARCGFSRVTFCPYMESDLWVAALARLETTNPGLVTAFNLQCYAGGAWNDPWTWVDAIAAAVPDGPPVYPGLWCRHGAPACDQGDCPADVESTLAGWRTNGDRVLSGAWMWMYDDIQGCASSGCCGGPAGSADYAAAITRALAPPS